MHPNHNPKRRGPGAPFALESLETRELLTGGTGDTFAIVRGEIAKPGQPAAIKFTLDSTHFTMPKGKMLLGVDTAATSDSTAKPAIKSVVGQGGAMATQTSHARYDRRLKQTNVAPGSATSAALTHVTFDRLHPTAPAAYTVNVDGKANTAGKFLVGFYLPGDANGDGVVNQADVTVVKTAMNSLANDSRYNFEADANRDGKINALDLMYTMENLGVKTDVTPVVSANLDPANNVSLQGRVSSAKAVTFSGAATPGASVTYKEAQNKVTPVSAKVDATGNYTINVPLGTGSNTFNVTTQDSFGQSITGTINPVTYVDTTSVVTPAKLDALKTQAGVSVTKA